METFKALLVRTRQQEQILDLPERCRIKMYRINTMLMKLLDNQNKSVKLYFEVVNGRVIQKGFSDELGLIKYDGVG